MEQVSHNNEQHFQLKMDTAGRVVLPTNTQLRQLARSGETIIAVERDDGSLHLKTTSQVVKEVQHYFSQFVKPGEVWSEELTRERREEAARE